MRDQLTDWRQYAACDTLMMPGDPPGCRAPAGQPCRIGPVNADPAVERPHRLLPHIGRALLIERATDADGAPLWRTGDGEVVSRIHGDEPPNSEALYTLVPGTDAVIWPEPGSHTAGLTGPFHRYAECTNDRCPIHPD